MRTAHVLRHTTRQRQQHLGQRGAQATPPPPTKRGRTQTVKVTPPRDPAAHDGVLGGRAGTFQAGHSRWQGAFQRNHRTRGADAHMHGYSCTAVVAPMTATVSLLPSSASRLCRNSKCRTPGSLSKPTFSLFLLSPSPHQSPHRCVIIIEACEESGSPDLPFYIQKLLPDIGTPSLIVCLDSGKSHAVCGTATLWVVTGLHRLWQPRRAPWRACRTRRPVTFAGSCSTLCTAASASGTPDSIWAGCGVR